MKKCWIQGFIFLLCLFLLLPCLSAGSRLTQTGKSYNIEVVSVDLYEHTSPFTGKTFRAMEIVSTSGRQKNVNTAELKYDLETEKAETCGRFEEDAPVALVKVDGFAETLCAVTDPALLIVLVDGVPLEAAGADYEQDIGWQNVYGGAYGVVFPVKLTREGGKESHTIAVTYIVDGNVFTETACISIVLTNTHEYKDEKVLKIKAVQGKNAEVCLIGNRLCIELPKGNTGEKSITLTFCDGEGNTIEGIAYLQQSKSAGGTGAIYLSTEEVKLQDGTAAFLLDAAAEEARKEELVLTVETRDCIYQSEKLLLRVRQDVAPKELLGVGFSQESLCLRVGQELVPQVIALSDGAVVENGLWYKVELSPQGDSDAVYAEGDTLLGTRVGTAYVRARVTSCDGKCYETGILKATVQEGAGERYIVVCRRLNVRVGAGTDYEKCGTLARGDTVEVVRILDGWAMLKNGDYVLAKYLSKAQ